MKTHIRCTNVTKIQPRPRPSCPLTVHTDSEACSNASTGSNAQGILPNTKIKKGARIVSHSLT